MAHNLTSREGSTNHPPLSRERVGFETLGTGFSPYNGLAIVIINIMSRDVYIFQSSWISSDYLTRKRHELSAARFLLKRLPLLTVEKACGFLFHLPGPPIGKLEICHVTAINSIMMGGQRNEDKDNRS